MIDVALARMTHLVFAALWAGSVCFVALVVVPLARDGAFRTTQPLESITGSLKLVSRVSSVVLFLTGSHLAGRLYTVETLGGSPNGHLVITMTVLWLVLTALVEVAAARFGRGLAEDKLREPAHQTLTLFRLGALVAIALLVVAGSLSGNLAGFL
ncbi:copper resistance protein CopD [Halovivax limisalsi]|uniref:copper resistance protein CopD n=1 Tax=Halovivax limisalsi TaxID=1453760 RepID=UPI001FFD9FC5|nr:copper resistance protein CopD [Halovivax limisalsi]